MDFFYEKMSVFISYPFFALVPVAILLILAWISHKKIVFLIGMVWLAYVIYEYGMKLRILCSGECNIRIDLLIIYPILLLLFVLALLVFVRGLKK